MVRSITVEFESSQNRAANLKIMAAVVPLIFGHVEINDVVDLNVASRRTAGTDQLKESLCTIVVS